LSRSNRKFPQNLNFRSFQSFLKFRKFHLPDLPHRLSQMFRRCRMHLSFPMSRWFRSFRHSRRSNPMFQMY
jgi:hypothetical protein